MKWLFFTLSLGFFVVHNYAAEGETMRPLFDGRTFAGWEGGTNKTWRIEQGAIVGGSLETQVPRNEFLCTMQPYTNFVLRLKVKLLGIAGFLNAGIQFRSQRIKNPPNEMSGYQADIGEPNYWGDLYDESRRNKALVKANQEAVNGVLKRNDWNDYVIRCEGQHIQLFINGLKTADYTETDPTISQQGLIGLQIHGGGKAEAWYKEIMLQALP